MCLASYPVPKPTRDREQMQHRHTARCQTARRWELSQAIDAGRSFVNRLEMVGADTAPARSILADLHRQASRVG